ncbi:hypothetical protein B9G98_03586 [Wickerhamiella sorbophila]|uniref:Uncharacterized protein n=1 Tax=Wickerhamiella sorbophila TaxID=45607 RepID=A0A2T0FLV8_9ASCO|nr:hypothetical protein B9G98_03586 [Wickerhamiella sorbophila]PRT55966.1 hypothetical protein B9G98_03586 [Wickerhamiella sorbophila]
MHHAQSGIASWVCDGPTSLPAHDVIRNAASSGLPRQHFCYLLLDHGFVPRLWAGTSCGRRGFGCTRGDSTLHAKFASRMVIYLEEQRSNKDAKSSIFSPFAELLACRFDPDT